MILAAAEYAEGKLDEPPPMLRAALQYGQVSQDAWLDLPAKMAQRFRYLNWVYESMRGYVEAGRRGKSVEWTRQHPREWEQVTRIIKHRKEQRGK